MGGGGGNAFILIKKNNNQNKLKSATLWLLGSLRNKKPLC